MAQAAEFLSSLGHDIPPELQAAGRAQTTDVESPDLDAQRALFLGVRNGRAGRRRLTSSAATAEGQILQRHAQPKASASEREQHEHEMILREVREKMRQRRKAERNRARREREARETLSSFQGQGLSEALTSNGNGNGTLVVGARVIPRWQREAMKASKLGPSIRKRQRQAEMGQQPTFAFDDAFPRRDPVLEREMRRQRLLGEYETKAPTSSSRQQSGSGSGRRPMATVDDFGGSLDAILATPVAQPSTTAASVASAAAASSSTTVVAAARSSSTTTNSTNGRGRRSTVEDFGGSLDAILPVRANASAASRASGSGAGSAFARRANGAGAAHPRLQQPARARNNARPSGTFARLNRRLDEALESLEGVTASVLSDLGPRGSDYVTDSNMLSYDELLSLDVPSVGKMKTDKERGLHLFSSVCKTVTYRSKRTKSSGSGAADEEEEECTICLEAFQHRETIKELPCGHRYHCECLKSWLTTSATPTCPLCRARLDD